MEGALYRAAGALGGVLVLALCALFAWGLYDIYLKIKKKIFG